MLSFAVILLLTACLYVTPAYAQEPATAEAEDPSIEIIKPALEIPIPDLRFSRVILTEDDVSGERTLDIPFIADYISALYRYAIGVAAVLATVMIMIGGLQYLMAGGDATRVSNAKKRITDAVIGLLLSLGTYMILVAINPDLVSLKNIKVKLVKRIEFAIPEVALVDTEDFISGSAPANYQDKSTWQKINEECIKTRMASQPSIVPHLKKAGEVFCGLKGENATWRIIGGCARNPDTGVKMFVKRCLYRSKCTVPTGSLGLRQNSQALKKVSREGESIWVPTSPSLQGYTHEQMKKDSSEYRQVYNFLFPLADDSKSAHGSGFACDLFCDPVSKSVFGPHVECQKLLEQAMKDAGFCRLEHEWWHFEHTSSVMSKKSCNANWTIGRVKIDGKVYDYGSCKDKFNYYKRECY